MYRQCQRATLKMLFTVIWRRVWAFDFSGGGGGCFCFVWLFFVCGFCCFFCLFVVGVIFFFQSCKNRGGKKEIHSFKLLSCAYSSTYSEHGWSEVAQAPHIQCAKSIFTSIGGSGCSPSLYGGARQLLRLWWQEPACGTICCCCCHRGVPSTQELSRGAGAAGAALSHFCWWRI